MSMKRVFWQFDDSRRWEFMSPIHSEHIKDKLAAGQTSAQLGQYEYDLEQMTQRNRITSKVRKIRPYEFDCCSRWERQAEGRWERMPDDVSVVIQKALAVGKTTIQYQKHKFDLVGNIQTNTDTQAATPIRKVQIDPANDVPVKWEPEAHCEYEDDNGEWQPMANGACEEIQQKLEAAEESAKYKYYTFNLMAMTQTNVKTETTRRIRCSPLDPQEREALRKRRAYRLAIQSAVLHPLLPVHPNHDDFQWGVQQAFLATRAHHRRSFHSHPSDLCGLPQFTDIRVERAACGPAAAAAFAQLLAAQPPPAGCTAAGRRLLADRVADGLHELLRAPWLGAAAAGPDAADPRALLGWHGASDAAARDIVRRGFDPALRRTGAGGMFGRAFYFAEKSSKADLYAAQPGAIFRRPAGRLRVLLCLILCGPMREAREALRGAEAPPPPTAAERAALGGAEFGSVMAQCRAHGGAIDSREWVVFDPARALPVAVVTYRHAAGCACCRCSYADPPPD